MTVSVAEVQSTLAAKISALSGFRQVRQLPEMFGRAHNTLAHLGFSVEVAQTSEIPERQRIPVGLYVNSSIRVKFAYRLRPHDIILDYGNALDKEQAVISVLLARNFAKGIEVKFIRATRRTPESQEYLISEIEINALHTIQIN